MVFLFSNFQTSSVMHGCKRHPEPFHSHRHTIPGRRIHSRNETFSPICPLTCVADSDRKKHSNQSYTTNNADQRHGHTTHRTTKNSTKTRKSTRTVTADTPNPLTPPARVVCDPTQLLFPRDGTLPYSTFLSRLQHNLRALYVRTGSSPTLPHTEGHTRPRCPLNTR